MTGFDEAAERAVEAAYDGDAPVGFERLEAEPATVSDGFVRIPGASLAALAHRAFSDMQFMVRPSYARQLRDAALAAESGSREALVLRALADNLRVAAEGSLPLCQDTGTAAVYGWKGERLVVDDDRPDRDLFAAGAEDAWREHRLRDSQVAPLGGRDEANTGNNLPLAGELFARKGSSYHLLFVAKGGGSSNKTALFQETKRLLEPELLAGFLRRTVESLGVSACPPYRVVVVIGGQSPEECLLAAKLAGAGALDALPRRADGTGSPYRDVESEAAVMAAARNSGWGAQFGGSFMALDARVIRLARHAASLPVALAVSCAAHRQAYGRIDAEGVWVERLAGPAELTRILDGCGPESPRAEPGGTNRPRRVDLAAGVAGLAGLRAGDLVELWGDAVLARDAVHARLSAMMDRGEALPAWTALPAFYASPTKTPPGAVIGSIGPTTSKRMDAYLERFMERGVFRLTIGKGERGTACAEACLRHDGAYFAAVGGAAALAGSKYVESCRLVDWEDLGMEAVRVVGLAGLPAMLATAPDGSDFYDGVRSRQRR